MSASTPRPLRLLSALALLAAPAAADDIYLVDGSTVLDCQVQSETVEEVEYRLDGKKDSVASDKVLRVEYSAMPTLVDRAENAVADEQIYDAISDLKLYVDGFLSGNKRERYDWAPAYAAFRLIQLYRMVGEAEPAIAAADRLIDSFPKSRYLPYAYLLKARTQAQADAASKGLQTLKDLEAIVQTQGLSKRWELEGELATILIDPSLKGRARRDALIELSSKAGRSWPTVKNAAEVAEAETLLEAKDYGEAEKILQRIVDDPKASAATLAAAYTGLGECLFQRAANMEKGSAESAKLLKEALMHFMRVVVVTPGQTAYVPKAMFYAGRIFDMSEDPQSKDNAQKLYRAVIRTYDGSKWATEARGFRKR